MQTFLKELSEHLDGEFVLAAVYSSQAVSRQPLAMFCDIFLTPSDESSYCDSFITDSLLLVLRSAHRIWLCTLSIGMGQ